MAPEVINFLKMYRYAFLTNKLFNRPVGEGMFHSKGGESEYRISLLASIDYLACDPLLV